jgi:hypothetical protein
MEFPTNLRLQHSTVLDPPPPILLKHRIGGFIDNSILLIRLKNGRWRVFWSISCPWVRK